MAKPLAAQCFQQIFHNPKGCATAGMCEASKLLVHCFLGPAPPAWSRERWLPQWKRRSGRDSDHLPATMAVATGLGAEYVERASASQDQRIVLAFQDVQALG